MRKSRQYRRVLGHEELHDLRAKYANLLESKRGGWLPFGMREWLLGLKREEKELDEAQLRKRETDKWSRIRSSAHDAMKDLTLVCDIADEKELAKIFNGNPDSERPFFDLLKAILLPENLELHESDWRKNMRDELAARILDRYINSEIIKDGLRKRILSEALEVVQMVTQKEWSKMLEEERNRVLPGDLL